MSLTASTVPTRHASRAPQQLCKHWSHRFAVTFDDTHGSVALPSGTLSLNADAAAPHLSLDAPDLEAVRAEWNPLGPIRQPITMKRVSLPGSERTRQTLAALPRLSEVVAEHLRRFAFREELAIDWSAPLA